MSSVDSVVLSAIEAKKEEIFALSDQIWDFSELSLQETRSCALYCDLLRQEGFSVEAGICGIETAFSASFGTGRPVIGLLAEYDALSGLSQVGGSLSPESLTPGGCGHGCGHNLLGAGAFAAALGVKAYLEESGQPGTVILYGCPGEEGGAAKAFMARDGVWRGLDAALTWHPGDCNEVLTGSTNSCIQVQYTFSGVASHAAGAPEQGRSALDAVELLNIGVQFLREHTTPDARIHYAVTDAGGRSPNVVQPKATVLYMVRSNRVADAVKLQKRVDKIAEAAAMMTETKITRKFIDGCADTIPNHALEAVLYDSFSALGVPSYTEQEHAFADALAGTYAGSDATPGVGSVNREYARQVSRLRAEQTHAMNDFLLPLCTAEVFRAGSTDVGDVSWLCPTAQIGVASIPNGCPGHSWQVVSCGTTDIGKKAVLHAGKVLAAATVRLMQEPELLQRARAEFEERTASGFVCPIEEGAKPTIAD